MANDLTGVGALYRHDHALEAQPVPKALVLREQDAAPNREAVAQTAAHSTAAPAPSAEPHRPEPVSPERQRKIDEFVDAHDSDNRWGGNKDEAKAIGDALKGESELGPLDGPERQSLANRAVEVWGRSGNADALETAAARVQGDSAVARPLAAAMLERVAQRDVAIALDEAPAREGSEVAFDDAARAAAVALDPAGAVAAYRGRDSEGVLAGHLTAEGADPEARLAVLDAIANGEVPPESAERMVNALFAGSDGSDLAGGGTRDAAVAAWAGALARVTRPDVDPSSGYARDLLQERLEAVLETEGGRQVLFGAVDSGAEVPLALRQFTLAETLRGDGWDATALAQGWESDVVVERFNEQLQARYASIPQGVGLRGGDLETYVGLAMGMPRAEGGTEARPFAGDEHVARVRDNIEALAGEHGTVSAIAVPVGSNEFGLTSQIVFRVDRPGHEPAFVDQTGHMAETLDEWMAESTLPDGRMVIREGLSLDGAWRAPQNTPEVNDTFGEKFWSAADSVAVGVGVAALVVGGGAAIFFSGGAATPAVVAAAGWAGAGTGLYQAGRAGYELADDGLDGLAVADLGDPTMRGRWLTLAAGGLSFGALGALSYADEVRAATGATSRALSTGVVGLNTMAFAADAATTLDMAHGLRENWDRMSAGERAFGLAQVAFWGGMAGQSVRQGGGLLNTADLARAERLVRTGTPYEMQRVPGWGEGQVRVEYEGRRPVIQHGGEGVDPQVLARHTEVAHTIERAQGLEGRLRELMGLEGLTEFAPGTAGFEAELEIRKIGSEADAIRQDLNRGLAPADQAAALYRLNELQQSLALEQARFDAPGEAGHGWVSDASRGADLVRGVDPALVDGAPAGHHWHRVGERHPGAEVPADQMAVRGEDGVEYLVALYRHDATAEHMAFDRELGDFVAYQGPPRKPAVPRGDFENAAAEALLTAQDGPLDGPAAIAVVHAEAERQGQPIHSSKGNDGVVSVLPIDGEVYVGVNSHNHPLSDMALHREWDRRLNPNGDVSVRRMLYHAEAESLIRAYAARGGDMPDSVVLYTDDAPCYQCRTFLHDLAEEMGIQDLRIEVADGRTFIQSDGLLQEEP